MISSLLRGAQRAGGEGFTPLTRDEFQVSVVEKFPLGFFVAGEFGGQIYSGTLLLRKGEWREVWAFSPLFFPPLVVLILFARLMVCYAGSHAHPERTIAAQEVRGGWE